MIEFSIRGMTVRITFPFVAVTTLMLLIDRTGLSFMGLCACLIHESGHFLAFFLAGHTPKLISFEVSGIRLVKQSPFLCYPKELFILSAGCVANGLTALLFWYGMPTPGGRLFAAIHCVLGLFNLLPIGALDGGRMLRLLLLLRLDPSAADKVCRTVSFAILIPLFLLAGYLLLSSRNITLMITACYLLLLVLFQSSD